MAEPTKSIVELAAGRILGSVNEEIHVFRGVPYAESLAGEAKWLPPRPRLPWSGTRDARSQGPSCQQFRSGSRWRLPLPVARRRYFEIIDRLEHGDSGDDCLLLDVWTPSLDRDARLPVLIYIHGGGLQTGSAHGYDCTRLARRGIVAAVIQYRLGPLGFLHGSGLFPDDICADNRGFLDQICALQWVQDNIAAFGGDPSCVTISGESAGAQSVYLLAASPMAKGLFRRAIAMGGNTYAHAPADEYRLLAQDALQDVGVAAGDRKALASLDTHQLRKLYRALASRAFRDDPRRRYGSISDVAFNYVGAATGTDFLPSPPPAAYARRTPNDVDFLLGTCRDEGNIFSLILPPSRSLSAQWAARKLGRLTPGRDIGKMLAHYRGQMNGSGTGALYDQVNTDIFFRAPTVAAAEAHASAHSGRTFHYQIDCPGSIPGLGAMHGIDVGLVLGAGAASAFVGSDPATLRLSDLMLEAWTAFVRTGRPAAIGLPVWEPYDATRRATMLLDHECRLESDPGAKLLQYWRRGAIVGASNEPRKEVSHGGDGD